MTSRRGFKPSIQPIPNATCRIFEGSTEVGVVQSGQLTTDLGVINTQVEVNLTTSQLTLRCFRAGFSNASEIAPLVIDPGNPQFGTFTATVVMKRGVGTEVISSNATELVARVHVPSFNLSRVDTAAGPFDKIDNFDNALALAGGGVDNLSAPEVPVFKMYFAVPNGEEIASVEVGADSDGETVLARLYPVQPPHYDRAGFDEGSPTPIPDEPFEFDIKRYLAGSVSVADQQVDSDVGADDGVNIYQLRMNLVDYDAGREVMTRSPSLRVNIKFTSSQAQTCFRIVKVADGLNRDGVDQMLEDQGFSLNPQVVNASMLTAFACNLEFKPIFFGARLVIVSAPEFLAASNNLRAHKVSRGISTIVVDASTLSAGAVTPAAIKAYLQNAYDHWFVRPKWLLLMGDAEFIPTFYDSLQNSGDSAYNAGDIFYGQLTGGITSLPVLGIGRIPVDTNDQAQTVVDKIVAYENNPPGSLVFDNPYYSKVAFAAEFQDNGQGSCFTALDGRAERWFAETSEKIRNYLVTQSINVERIYTTDPANAFPTTYRDGNPVPLYLRKPTFPWDGDRFDVRNAVNDGRSILYHRDHGWWWGWGTPYLDRTDLDFMSVSGNEFPVVYSINCASGLFDNETVDLPANKVGSGYGPDPTAVYWAEKFLRKADGAIAVIGDTRSSSTVLNNDLAQGLFDATWPGHLAYAGTTGAIRKVGDVLNHAKGYIKSLAYAASSERQENVIYNVLGDPTVEVRTRPPKSIFIQTILPEVERVIIGIQCLQCPPIMEPIVVVAQDADGNEMARGLAMYNGKSFSAELGLGMDELQKGAVLTASGFDVLTSQVNYQPER